MAPNIPVNIPNDEVLVPPTLVQENENAHGTHRVISNYPKLVRDIPVSREISTETPSKESHHHSSQDHKLGKMLVRSDLFPPLLKSNEENSEESGNKFQSADLHSMSPEKKSDLLSTVHLTKDGRITHHSTIEQTAPAPKPTKSFMLESIEKNNNNERGVSSQSPRFEARVPLDNFKLDSKYFVSLFPSITTYKPKHALQNFENVNNKDKNSKIKNQNAESDFNGSKKNRESKINGDDNKKSNKNNSQKAKENEKISKNGPSTTTVAQPHIKTDTTESPNKNDGKSAVAMGTITPSRTNHLYIEEDIYVEGQPGNSVAHLQEELADFSNLFHHEKSLDELSRGGKDVEVRGDDWFLSGEGATAVILVGMCSTILMLICLIFLLKKWKRQITGKKEKGEVDEEKHSHHHHKSHFGTDLHIPASLIPHLPFIHNSVPHSTSKEELVKAGFMNVEDHFTDAEKGRLWFSLKYDDESSCLTVNISHARYPKGRGVTTNTGDLWVEGMVISPMNTIKGASKTSPRKATQSPIFNHNFFFELSKDELSSYILKLTLHDRPYKRSEETVGSIIFPFSSVDLKSKEIYSRDLL